MKSKFKTSVPLNILPIDTVAISFMKFMYVATIM